MVRGFLPVIGDWGFDKKSGVFNSAGGLAGEFALILLPLGGSNGRVEGSFALLEACGFGFCDWVEPRRPDLLD